MDDSSPRSREVVNTLFQIDRLTENQIRAVLRHLTIDDAVFNEAQCSHVAGLISGTLHQVPREGVNATLTCDTSLKAAASWEKSFASYPGHVSATFHQNSLDSAANNKSTPPRTSLPRAGETAPAEATGESNDIKASTSGPLDLKGLTIVNHGNLTLHYHSYMETSHDTPQSAILPRKRTFAETEDQQYSEALASLTDFNNSIPHASPLESLGKLLKTKEPETGREKGEITRVEPEALEQSEQHDEKCKEQEEQNDEQVQNRKEDQDAVLNDDPMIEKKNRPRRCARCGERYEKADNEGLNLPCCYHPVRSASFEALLFY
ncbi:hypothetical protein INS49_012019 [Diaporthe citri]|uniref:uncharacterized protein n=1 Tax=Diaporthe citri TaxID=83186 RepID=UPI001C8177A2|nr:uncharacterized protein INS49_012019 [Diaporthe citri]KAG6360951.1 hypothetical protein INS49_012019 [Diaporthe citri]